MAEPHDRCETPRCTLGRAHVGPHVGAPTDGLDAWAAGPYLAASPLAVETAGDVAQLVIDLQAMASEEDERARSAQRRAADLRAMVREINAWRAKITLASTGASNTGRGSNP